MPSKNQFSDKEMIIQYLHPMDTLTSISLTFNHFTVPFDHQHQSGNYHENYQENENERDNHLNKKRSSCSISSALMAKSNSKLETEEN